MKMSDQRVHFAPEKNSHISKKKKKYNIPKLLTFYRLEALNDLYNGVCGTFTHLGPYQIVLLKKSLVMLQWTPPEVQKHFSN